MTDMRRSAAVIGAAFVATAVLAAAVLIVRQQLTSRHVERQWGMLERYCTECHSAAEAAGNLVFEGLGPESVPEHAEIFEAAVRKLRGRLMPPPGNPAPGRAEADAFIAWLETSIDRGTQGPRAAHVPVQRLSRAEYAIAVNELLGIEIDPADYLPTEIEVDGFTNIAAALSVSPAFLEQYISVARTVARLAVGSSQPKLASTYFPPPSGDQDDYVAGMPLGTRGGTMFAHNFPADGEYRITIHARSKPSIRWSC
jgi:hypothetical protein